YLWYRYRGFCDHADTDQYRKHIKPSGRSYGADLYLCDPCSVAESRGRHSWRTESRACRFYVCRGLLQCVFLKMHERCDYSRYRPVPAGAADWYCGGSNIRYPDRYPGTALKG